MRPNIGAYKDLNYPEPYYTPMHTPNLDALASESMLFANAFVSKAFCNPSRTCILLGRRSDSTRVYTNNNLIRDLNPNAITLPQFFKQKGYWSVGYGKVIKLHCALSC